MKTTPQVRLLFLFALAVASGMSCYAQVIKTGDDYYERTMAWEQAPQPMQYVRESDVVWDKLIWCTLDVREKENQYFYYPVAKEGIRGRKNLAYVLWDAIVAGEIPIYEDDEFKIPIDNELFVQRCTKPDTVRLDIEDEYGDVVSYESAIVPREFSSEEIFQYGLKELYYIEKERTDMYMVKIGLAPMQDQFKKFGGEMEYAGTVKLFWVPMLSEQVRRLFARKESYCENNMVHMPTWEYCFRANMFTTFITRESNRFNRSISDYLTGEDAMLEAERIEMAIMDLSSDMWEY